MTLVCTGHSEQVTSNQKCDTFFLEQKVGVTVVTEWDTV